MFHEIPKPMIDVMRELEAQDRKDHTISKQVPPDVGRLLAILAASAGTGTWLELGTSCGYSAMWLSLACRLRGTRLITVDADPQKVRIATQNLERAQVQDLVEVVEGDSIEQLDHYDSLDFCFIDAGGGKGTYDIVVPKMKPGGLFIYDHTKARGAEIIAAASADHRVDAVLVPIASDDARTELICRRCP
ncbi:MAG: class I SAM-dependent methyltransferase [Gammaproteobacteria bacterium]|nr:class I SAM-dependent methyltransferase [Gammaproteobacteria bacterium]